MVLKASLPSFLNHRVEIIIKGQREPRTGQFTRIESEDITLMINDKPTSIPIESIIGFVDLGAGNELDTNI